MRVSRQGRRRGRNYVEEEQEMRVSRQWKEERKVM